ncbi:TPA: hypothetical protein ACUI2G_001912 [Klebsiella pneumoniae]
MSELEERIADLEGIVSNLQLSEHASRIAITILSSVVNSMSQTPGLLAQSYADAAAKAGPIEFDFPTPEGYEELLHQRVLSLLSKSEETN